MGLLRLFHGKADIVDLVLRHYHGTSGWGTVRFAAAILCVRHGPASDVIAAGGSDGRIHLICAHTGEKIACPLKFDGQVQSVLWSPCGKKMAAACNVHKGLSWEGSVKIVTTEGSAGTFALQSTLTGHTR